MAHSINDQIRVLTTMREQAQAQAAQADQGWRDNIVAALMRGVPASDVAEAAGVSRARVYQIRDGKR